ncbi:hypothetical protein A2303_03540 [Candidatus Falkowbacteria bacterium RIFOXYB2_FULL_47_14]|uniref:Fibronectin type-III domain-containing protein n=1 Tax=Candidatus Falkowbacteria bacterium RIFOXYA2_FULL_47_19 TaxID=1797994 RepID=A0A1F5SHV2_9BACT|nr:MAG: hypothetical protein A2227_03085 [Candidatus Falkowbacteria bacterium RIFOXYA2_FULL_47_19]OGF42472.1 MAG: hypothetical protein A2303_03540 [Candidatus Falkowbacteria bacterium RIFOXYB2_FULL_47_14]
MLKKRNKIIFIAFTVVITLIAVGFVVCTHPVLAQSAADNMLWGGTEGNVQTATGLGNTDPRVIVANVIRIALGFLGVIAVVLIMYGGWLWMTSNGNAAQLEKAKKTLVAAVIGLIIILMSFAIASFVLNSLLSATGGNACNPGDPPRSCGCYGTQVCQADNTWGPCSGVCGGGDVCCPLTGCQAPPCSPGGTVDCDSVPGPTCSSPDNMICDTFFTPGTYFCDPTACTCSPLGGFGDPCDGDSATAVCDATDSMCVSGLRCDDTVGSPTECRCIGAPVIDWVSPPDGARGNLVTIGGRFFGAAPGEVYFNGVLAPFPNTVNPNCTAFWSDNQVIVVVPAGAPMGANVIRLVRSSDTEEDTTDNARGPVIDPGFIVNNTVRPGLCQLSTTTGYYQDIITYQGINLPNGTRTYFGNYTDNIAALNSLFTDPQGRFGTAGVPDMRAGNTTTFASSTNPSNYLNFRVSTLTVTGPYITGFEPSSGPPGQYVTIYGGGFGAARGGSSVSFGATEADYDFPEDCADSVWTDHRVIVKVPDGISGSETIFMDVGSWPQIDTGTLNPAQFSITAGAPAPSICRITPIMGPNNSPVSLYGEYFGAADDTVWFHLNHGQTTHASWLDNPDPNADTIVTTVHQLAVTGPVSVEQSGSIGNSIDFTVGLCTNAPDPDAACGGVCCPSGTFRAGRCATDAAAMGGNGDGFVTIEDCYNRITSSVYEWEFTSETGTSTIPGGLGDPCYVDALTTPGCNPIYGPCQIGLYCDNDPASPTHCTCQTAAALESCSGYSMDQCLNSRFCPNSPGQCSTDPGGSTETVGTCDSSCSSVSPACAGGACSYNSVIDRCVDGSNCDLSPVFYDILNNPAQSYCADYSGAARWHLRTNLSCPTSTPGWIKIPPGNVCVNPNLPCLACANGLECLDDLVAPADEGVCAIAADICPPGATCAANRCELTSTPACECCCEIGQDARDCCVPLECTGSCGSGGSFGECSGCALAGTTQAERNDACNCTGTSGKFCDTADPGYPDGVCRDCTGLAGAADCLNIGVGSCCFDEKDNVDICRGGDGTILGGSCPYWNCLPVPNNDTCNTGAANAVIDGDYRDEVSCVAGCLMNNPANGLGLSCAYQVATNTCDTAVCPAPFGCINEDGSAPTPFNVSGNPDTCGVCCCDPGSADCDPLGLDCQADKSPCTGGSRGLCCGCDTDLDCSLTGIPPVNVGCGIDTCCRARPTIVPNSEMPADDAVNICRNAVFSVTFNQPMSVASFSGNVIVVGDYMDANCPAGTEYLASDIHIKDRSRLASRIYNKMGWLLYRTMETILPSFLAEAYTPPAASRNYCAIAGSTGGSTLSGQTTLTFTPSSLLEGNRLYYVIIKGDENLDSNHGVLSAWGVGFNGGLDLTFNGITYRNSHVWSFRTLTEQSPNNGVCELNRVDVRPESYLFQTTRNDINNENDTNPADPTFDKITDADKVFTAYPLSRDGQVLGAIPGLYDWTWTWTSGAPQVADIAAPGPFPVGGEDKKLVVADAQTTDGYTLLSARAIIGSSVIPTSPAGTVYPGSADVYVFVCENPWPPVIGGLWAPWQDAAGNCTQAAGGCANSYNYEIYYCRDQGQVGTFDDLPAITYDRVIVGENLPGLLKEYYFFREAAPVSTTTLNVTNGGTGGSVTATWNPPVAGASGYRLYWGTSPGFYGSNVDAGNILSYNITGLTDDIPYYFNITSYNAAGAESGMNGEFGPVIPRDTTAPLAPTGLTGTAGNGEARLSWNPDTTGSIADYTVYFRSGSGCAGATPPACYGNSEDIGLDEEIIISGLTAGTNYYFAITGSDDAGNESGYSNEVMVMPN